MLLMLLQISHVVVLHVGPCIFKRRELATSIETRSKFPELVIQEEKRVRFVVVNGLTIIEKPTKIGIDDAEWYVGISWTAISYDSIILETFGHF